MSRFAGKRNAPRAALAALALLAAGCGEIVNMGSRDVNPRRVYVNDAARNDSLPSTLREQGLLFVMQPGESYRLRLKTPAAADSLHFYVRGAGGTFNRTQILGSADLGGGFRAFSLQPPAEKLVADFYLVFLNGTGGARATLPDSVRLAPVDTAGATTIAVRLLMVRGLHIVGDGKTGVADASDKSEFSRAFHQELISIYQAYGITVDTSTLLVEPDGAPLTVTFANASRSLPGTRRTGAMNLYLVDDIDAGEDVAGTVLGFAPREALDLSSDVESRVVLNVRGGTPTALAVTAAHEMGHFLGLRHTTATAVDRDYDDDESNRDDGFASTPLCLQLGKPAALGRIPATEVTRKSASDRPYCLHVAAGAATCGVCADEGNLMFPYACTASQQKALGSDQRFLIRNNLRTFQ